MESNCKPNTAKVHH